MNPILFYILSGVLSAAVLAGLSMQSKVKTAVSGNLICVGVMGLAILLTLVNGGIRAALLNPYLWLAMAAGAAAGLFWASRVKMIGMPQVVALLNGIGGLASALVGAIELVRGGGTVFAAITAALALVIGGVTASGSLIAALKLSRRIDGKPKSLPHHDTVTFVLLAACALGILLAAFGMAGAAVAVCAAGAVLFGLAFALRVGGADMPVAISLLNSLSGVAGAIAGMAILNVLLVAIGGIVGSSGLLLTQIMCRAMNRDLKDILLGRTVKAAPAEKAEEPAPAVPEEEGGKTEEAGETCEDAAETEAGETAEAGEAPAEEPAAEEETFELKDARDVIIVPGYGMALSQAQHKVYELAEKLKANGARVRFAIHPVAGRMPGHMNVLLAEADVDYDDLFQLDEINDDFRNADAVVVVGASDVMNPAAREAEGTPIYGMPILSVDEAPHVFVCNYDLKPGYAGVENPLYSRKTGVRLLLGDAKDSLDTLIRELG